MYSASEPSVVQATVLGVKLAYKPANDITPRGQAGLVWLRQMWRKSEFSTRKVRIYNAKPRVQVYYRLQTTKFPAPLISQNEHQGKRNINSR